MKRIVKMLMALSMLVPLLALAETWTDPETGIAWSYVVKGGDAVIEDENAMSCSPSPCISTDTKGIVQIPSNINGYSVTSIGDYAFCRCSGLTSVTIPLSVTSIGESAFEGCSGLTGVTIPSSVTSIGDDAFYGCSGLTSVTIPEGVTSIGNDAFYGCSGLTRVTIPEGVTSIGEGAFAGCSGLTEFIVDADNPNYRSVNGLLLTKDGKTLICGVNGEVTIPEGVTSICYSAFAYCSGLTSVTIPSSVTSIGEYAFYGCSGLTSVTIPSSVTNIGERAFWECDKLQTVYVSYGDARRIKNLYDWDESIAFVKTDIQDETSSEEEPFDASIANTYDGVIVDSDGLPVGYISVKTTKASGKGDAKTSKVTATIQMVGEVKKLTVKATLSVAEATFTQAAADGRVLDLTFTRYGIWGTFDGYEIDGVRNLLASTAKSDKGTDAKVAADAVCAALKGNYVMAYEDENGWNGLSISIANKGKVKVSGKLANGTSVSVTSQLIVGDDYSVIPVIYTKKGTSLAFNVYYSHEDGEMTVFGCYDAVISPVTGLDSGLSFYLGEELYDLFEDYTLLDEYLPEGLSVEPSGSKLVVDDGAKAGKVVWDKKAGEINESKSKIDGYNVSGLKLTFTAKTGAFKGSFKVYAIDEKDALKTFTATVSGVVVDGVGYGVATIKKIGSCSVVIAE